MTILGTIGISAVAGAIGGVIGSWLTQKYGPIVILWYVVALVALFVIARYVPTSH